jgi:hypothetical protein
MHSLFSFQSTQVDYISHEIGHMFGAAHTASGCESSIMGGGAKCDTNAVQASNEAHFSLASLEEIQKFTLNPAGGGACGMKVKSALPPKLASNLGFREGKCQIPTGTGFVLSPNADEIVLSSKPGAQLSFAWEQADAGGPIFRSQVPIDTPVRYFPEPKTMFSDKNIPGEPTTWPRRNFRFSLTVRDSWQAAGDSTDARAFQGSGRSSFASAFVDVTVADVEPFKVVGVESLEALDLGAVLKVTWTVESVAALVQSQRDGGNAKVSTSYDGGETFSVQGTFSFAKGSGLIGLACSKATSETSVLVLVEVESTPGCSFYAIGSSPVKVRKCDGTAPGGPGGEASGASDSTTLYIIIASSVVGVLAVVVFVTVAFKSAQKTTEQANLQESPRVVLKDGGAGVPVATAVPEKLSTTV